MFQTSKYTIFLKFLLVFVLLTKTTISVSQEVIIKNGDVWSYYDNGYLSSNWYKTISIENWKKGNSPLGYNDDKIVTQLNFGSDENNKEITKYFSKEIFLNDINSFLAYEFKLLRDDGAVIYINGKELYRDNMPEILIENTTEAIRYIEKEEEDKYNSNVFDNKIFKNGVNRISIEIHQSDRDSSDCIFSLELVGHNNPDILREVLAKKNKENSQLESRIEILTNDLELEKLNSENKSLAGSNENLKFILFVFIFLLILLFIVAIFFINQLRRQQLKLEKNLENAALENQKKEKNLITLSTNLLHNKQYFKEIKADLKGVKTDDKQTIKSIFRQIDEILESDKDWANLKQHFNAVHEGFYDKLLEKHPELTETELRHCMFIKLHMQTKEIANILLIDPRSVQTARYRIKKKLELEENVDLREYLLNI